MSEVADKLRKRPPRRFEPYPAYKDSGVEWLREIPEHWEMRRLKHLGRIRYGLGEPPSLKDGGLPFIRATDIYRGRINGDAIQRVDPADVPWSRAPKLKSSDILVVRSGAYTGDSAIIPEEWAGAIAGYDLVLSVTKAAPKFIAFVLLSKYVLYQIYLAKMRAAQPHLNAEELGDCVVVLPTSDEQRAIAAFLDHETARIDALIEKKERLIELLQEKRVAVISRAVTKGLPAAAAAQAGLDPNVRMKDSGVEWLGEIPEHWHCLPLKRALSRNDGGVWGEDFDDAGTIVLRSTDMTLDGSWRIDEPARRRLTAQERLQAHLERGDLLVTKSSGSALHLGKTAEVTEELASLECCFSNFMQRLRSNARGHSRFLFWLINGPCGRKQLLLLGTTTTGLANLSAEIIGSISAPLPPLNEQRAIAAFLDRQTARIDALIEKIRSSIDLLREYRTALISAAVTGKVGVRREVA